MFERIECKEGVLGGKPVIKGTRLTVQYVLNLLGHGATVKEIVEDYEGLAPEDIQTRVRFARS